MQTYFLAWQDPKGRSWFPIGRLTLQNGTYEFVYTRGIEVAREQSGFHPLPMFPNTESVYVSDELFPLFANRVPTMARENYVDYVQWLGLPDSILDPLAVLARSGQRETDTFEVFPCPEPDADGHYRVHFFVHGLSHLPKESITRIEALKKGERLMVMWDFQNVYDPHALALRTNDGFQGDRYIIGFCPRYLTTDWLHVLTTGTGKLDDNLQVTVDRLNPAPAPRKFRLLCVAKGVWPPGFRPCSGNEYEPIILPSRIKT